MLELIKMANHYLSIVLYMQMHRTTEAVLEHLAVGALTRFHPLPVTEGLETVFPNVQKVILIDVALHIAAVDVATSRDGTVNKYRANGNAGTAEIEPVAHLAFIRANVGLTTEHAIHLPLLSGSYDEVHHLAELHITKLQAVVGCGTTNRGDGE